MNQKTREIIHSLWDELTDCCVGDSDTAVDRLMTVMCRLVNAQNASWIGAVRVKVTRTDKLNGWRVPALRKIQRPVRSDKGLTAELHRIWHSGEIDPSFLIGVKGVGKFRCWTLRRSMPSAWFKSPFYKNIYAQRKFYDIAYVSFPMNNDAESMFSFNRIGVSRAFSEKDIELLSYALRGIKWFHRQILLSHGLMSATSPLLPSERKVLNLLLTEASEKEMVARLRLTPATTHQYVKGIFRKFGVSGRSGLASLWLGRNR
jgi:DNA-binding CsgD family transcriptional regulator